MSTNALEWLKETRKWLITFIIFAIVLGVVITLWRIDVGKKEQALADKDSHIIKLDNLTKEQKASIDKLKTDLAAGATTKIVYKVVYKPQPGVSTTHGETVKPPSETTQEHFNAYCAGCSNEGISPYMRLETNAITCDANICDTKDVKCEAKTGYLLQIDKTAKCLTTTKSSIWHHQFLVGWEVVNNQPMIGYAPLDYKGIEFPVASFNPDLNKFSESRIGLGAAYSPRFGKMDQWKINISVGGGVTSKVSNFKDIGAAAFVSATVGERTPKQVGDCPK